MTNVLKCFTSLQASTLSLYEIPLVSTFATSDELTDPYKYEFFMRLAPPDRFQAQAMMDFVSQNEWSYISLLYSEFSYGENGGKQIERLAKEKNICIAYAFKVHF